MRTGMLALGLGLLAPAFLPSLPPAWALWGVVAGALLGLCLRAYRLSALLLGVAWACCSAQWALDDRLSPQLDGRTFWLEGQVSGLPDRNGRSVRFELRDIEARQHQLPTRLRISWFNGPAVREGERWRLAVSLKRPRGLVNPGGFDHEQWLLSRRIGATGSVKDGHLLVPARHAWRDDLRDRLSRVDAWGREGALRALVLGDGQGVSSADWAILQATGTVHLLVISGQHIGLVGALVYGLVAGLARLGLWPRRWPWLPWACALAMLAALGYGALAGFQVPVQRACLMLALVLLWRLRYRHLGVLLPLLVAFDAVLLIEPLVSLQPGFWLSFGAVAVLVLIFRGRLGTWRPWRAWGRAQFLIALGLLPMLLALGLPISLSGPLVNLVAVPWVSVGILPLALVGTLLLPWPGVGSALLWLAGGSLEALFMFLGWAAERAPAWTPPLAPGWLAALVGLGAVLVLLPAGTPLRPLGWPLLLLVVWPGGERIAWGQAQVWQLDVGQGLAVIVRTREHTLVYDTGPRTPGFDSGERVLVPTLRKLGVGRVDSLLISHAHLDHAGGAPALMRSFPAAQVLAGEPAGLPKAWRAEACRPGASWVWDGVTFTVWRWLQARESNPASCVLLVEASGERLLLTGDIDSAAERALLDSGLDVAADWVQAPHHGSRTSSSQRFIDAVAPRGVMIPRGHGNTFGHPHISVVERYRQAGASLHDNAIDGALQLPLGRFSGPTAWRSHRRFWRDDYVPAP